MMTIEEIEGLPHSELRARRDELVAVCKDVEPAVLAARYVQARTDAAMRDEKLADQAGTIAALRSGLKAAEDQIAAIDATAKQHIDAAAENVAVVQQALADQTAISEQIQAALDAAIAEAAEERAQAIDASETLLGQIKALEADCAQVKALAKARRETLVEVMNHANSLAAKVAPLLAAEG